MAKEIKVAQTAPAKTENVNQEQAANVTKPAEVAVPEKVYTSDKLTELNAKLTEQKRAARTQPEGSPEEDAAWMEVWSTKKLVDAEVASLKQQERDREIAETRAKLKQPLDDILAAYKDNLAAVGNDKLSIDDKNVINDKFTKLYDQIANVLMGGAARKSATVVKLADGEKSSSNGTRGGQTAAIRTLIAPMFAGGKTGAEVRKSVIHEHGFNDGTANAVILAYEKELGLK